MQAPVERQVSAAYNSIPSLDSARIALIKKNGEMAPIMQTGRIVSMCFHSFCWDHEEVLLNMSRCIHSNIPVSICCNSAGKRKDVKIICLLIKSKSYQNEEKNT